MTRVFGGTRLRSAMLSAYQLPISFDPGPLRGDVAHAEAHGLWIDHWADGVAAPGTWTVLALVAGAGDILEKGSGRLSARDGSQHAPILAELPHLRSAIETFETKVLRARLMRLKAGASIAEHRDFAYFSGQRWSFERGRIRVHIPIVGDTGVMWKLNGRALTMAAGEAWYVNVCLPHSVENRGAIDRINLVLELEVNEWLRGMFPAQNRRERLWSATLRTVEPQLLRVASSWLQRHSGAPVDNDSSPR